MSERSVAARRGGRSLGGRIVRAWRSLPPERRLAAAAAIGLFATLFAPWYQETVITTGVGSKFVLPSASLTGWAAFSFVEAAVLLVAVSVLGLLFARAEGRAFHVPGGDGGVVFAAGLWTAVLILWRMFDKSSTTGHGQYVTTSGVEWGIFVALGIAGLLAYAGTRIKLAHEPEPPLPGERGGPPAGPGRPPRSSDARPARTGRRTAPEPDDGWVTPDQSGTPRRPVPPRPGAPARRPDETATRVVPGEAATRALPDDPAATRQLPDDPVATRQLADDPAATRALPDDAAATQALPDRAGSPRRHGEGGKLNFSDLDEIEFDEPPEAPTVRQAPAVRRLAEPSEPPGSDDQLTMRLDQPE